MNYSPFLKMNYEELEIEISKQKKKIESAKETIKLLKKLQIAELAESDQKKTQQLPSSKPEFDQTAKQQNQQTKKPQQPVPSKPQSQNQESQKQPFGRGLLHGTH